MSLEEKAVQLFKLHHAATPVVLVNAWDVASARIVEEAGFPAIATTSAGVANALGYPDGQKIPWDGDVAGGSRSIASGCKCR